MLALSDLMTKGYAMQTIALSTISVDARCQPRVTMNPQLVDDYAAAMQSGERFPPLTVFNDGVTHWLADGFHRLAAAQAVGATEIDADVFDGDVRDAILYSVGANADHGLRRTNSDKRRAVETLLKDPEWSAWSDREIARRCLVSAPLVASVREFLTVNIYSEDAPRTYTDKHGNTSTMEVSNIGKSPAAFPQVHGSVPADVMADLFADVEDAEPEQTPLPPAINWEESDRKAADIVVRCRSNVSAYDAERVAYAVAAAGAAQRERVMTEALELRLWLGELTHRLNKIK